MTIEIPLRGKYRVRPAVKQQKSSGGNAGNKHAGRREQPKGAAELARAVTKANQRVKVLMPGGHTRFMRLAEWEAYNAARR